MEDFKGFLSVLCLGFLISGTILFIELRYFKLQEICEYCYFEGQRSYQEGKIHIDSTGTKWIDSPWKDPSMKVKFKYGVSSLGKRALENDFKENAN